MHLNYQFACLLHAVGGNSQTTLDTRRGKKQEYDVADGPQLEKSVAQLATSTGRLHAKAYFDHLLVTLLHGLLGMAGMATAHGD